LFAFEYQHNDYKVFIEDMAGQVGVSLKDNTLVFPQHIASGYYRMITLPNGLQANLINLTLNCNWYIHRKRSDEEFYTLRFDEFTIPDNLVMSIDNDTQTERETVKSLVYLTSSLFDFSYLGTAGTHARGINILLKPEFISNYLGLNSVDDLLQNYLALKAESYNVEHADMDYNRLMNEILYPEPDKPFADLYLLNRIQLLIEKFFTRLHHLANKQPLSLKLNNADINRIMQVEHLLTGDFSGRPPSIAQLAKASAMSVSSFKSNFKLIYGQPVYTYYQEHRLQKARELLISGKYNVKEAGEAVAYDNSSNFITAFKKQFNMSPGELIGGR
jgi:AraC-like DNA-binding protein